MRPLKDAGQVPDSQAYSVQEINHPGVQVVSNRLNPQGNKRQGGLLARLKTNQGL